MPIRAVLFDVGGPLDTEETSERLIDQHIREALAAAGVAMDAAAYAAANQWAVDSYAPNAYQAIIWRLCGGERRRAERVWAAVRARAPERRVFELRPGVPEVLDYLRRERRRLGLVANQPRSVLAELDAAGIGHYFDHREVAGTHGFRKPDVRIFLRACADLEVPPEQCLMVGDRLDNDIVPAKQLGMYAVRLRTGRHASQQPRSWEEAPDRDLSDITRLIDLLDSLIYIGGPVTM